MTLRARLLLGMAVVAVVLVTAAVSINRATEHQLVSQVDQQLSRAVPQLRGDRRPGGLGGPDGQGNDPGGPPGRTGPPTALYVATLDEGTGELTTVLLPSTTETSPGVPDIDAKDLADHLDQGPFTVGAVGSDLRYRAVVGTDGPESTTTIYALPLEDVDEAIDRLLAIQALASVVILITLGLVTFWVLRLGVRPVKRMTATAKAMGDGDLSQRIPESASGTEAGDLGVALNQMLGRIETAFDEQARSEGRLRQFVADASHELRTPVTTIRGYAELYRLGGLGDEQELNEAMRRTEQEATRMGQLVGDLLDLARLDQGRPLDLVPLDASSLAADAVADARAVEPTRPLTLDAPAPVVLHGDEAVLRQILANLLGNARVHTDADTPVAVRVRADGADAVIEVLDQGPGMAPEVAAHAFERFYRADPARTRHRGGSGLGLSIVASSVAAHGGTVGIESAPGQGTTVRVTLPLAPPTPDAPTPRLLRLSGP